MGEKKWRVFYKSQKKRKLLAESQNCLQILQILQIRPQLANNQPIPPVFIDQVEQDLVEDGQVIDPGNIIDFAEDRRHSEEVKVPFPLVGNVKVEDENSTFELQTQDLQSYQLEILVRISEDTKPQLRKLSPFEVEHLTSGKAVVNDLWRVYQTDKEVGDKMSMRRPC